MSLSTTGLLTGTRVLDFTQYLAGPTATRLMAEMGAEIIKVEQAKSGDPSRAIPFLKNGRSAYYIQQNRGKQSICVDFNSQAGIELIRSLVPKMDIVIDNYGPGVLARRGLDYESLKRLNPEIIACSVSVFGKEGPLSDRTGYDYIGQAYSGVMHMTGDADGPPRFVGVALADGIAGVNAFAALGYALLHRDRTGQGQFLDISMVDALYHMQSVELQMYSASGGAYHPMRFGIHHHISCPQGVFKSKEGYIVLLVLDRQWPNMTKAMGRPELEKDPRYATLQLRAKNQKNLIETIENWLQAFETDEEALKVLAENRVPAAPVLTIEETIEHPHFRARRMVRDITDPLLGPVTLPGFPFKFSAFPDELDLEAPTLGQHNKDVLSSHLNLATSEIEHLEAQGVLFRDNH